MYMGYFRTNQQNSWFYFSLFYNWLGLVSRPQLSKTNFFSSPGVFYIIKFAKTNKICDFLFNYGLDFPCRSILNVQYLKISYLIEKTAEFLTYCQNMNHLQGWYLLIMQFCFYINMLFFLKSMDFMNNYQSMNFSWGCYFLNEWISLCQHIISLKNRQNSLFIVKIKKFPSLLFPWFFF